MALRERLIRLKQIQGKPGGYPYSGKTSVLFVKMSFIPQAKGTYK